MIAGGTGVTPMFQLARRMLARENNTARITILFFNSTEEDIFLRPHLDELQSQHQTHLQVKYVVTRPSSWKGLTGRITNEMVQREMPPPGDDTLMLVCGPAQFNTAALEITSRLGYTETHKF